MNAATLREMLHKNPFHPFEIVMDNGQTHPVRHPDYLFVMAPADRAIVVEESGHFHILDLPHVTSLTVLPRRKTRARSAD
jgi:hypothetical protein